MDLPGHPPLATVWSASGALCPQFNAVPVTGQAFDRHLTATHGNPAALASDLQGAGVNVGASHGDGRMGLLIGFDIDAEPTSGVRRGSDDVPVIVMILKWRIFGPDFENDLYRFPCHRAGAPIHRHPEQLGVG